METLGTENLGNAPPFDTLAMVKHLERHGYTKEQAEGQTELLKHVVESNLATKTDLANVEATLKTDIAEIRIEIEQLRSATKRDIAEVRRDIAELQKELKADMKGMEYRMTIKLGTMVAGIVGFFMVMDKFF